MDHANDHMDRTIRGLQAQDAVERIREPMTKAHALERVAIRLDHAFARVTRSLEHFQFDRREGVWNAERDADLRCTDGRQCEHGGIHFWLGDWRGHASGSRRTVHADTIAGCRRRIRVDQTLRHTARTEASSSHRCN